MAKSDGDFLKEVRDKFERASEAISDNHDTFKDDIRFARLGEQWPEGVKKQRELDGRPCLVINRQPSFIRQVVNGARQNRPAITVIPADSNADPETAEIISGLIRNIEVSSDADVAYDTAIDGAVSGGFGYFRINTSYTSDDSFDQDIVLERIADPLTVFPDPDADSVDGSDWNCCFIVKTLTKDEFQTRYKGKEATDWEDMKKVGAPWFDDDNVLIAEYWHRDEESGAIVALSDGSVLDQKVYEARKDELAQAGLIQIGEPRQIRTKKVTQYILSGTEVLDTVEWPGKYIPIVPVYGEEVVIEGKRYFRSLICDAKDPQREHNYWRSAGAENVALAPKVPYIGPKGAFDSDFQKWNTANQASHSYIEYDGPVQPLRQPFVGAPVGEMQQAQMAVDDMKAIIGLYDSSLGAQSNETSGVAIRQRQRQGDIGTFHFIDNLTRSIRQAGRILIDLIPKVYSTARVIRVLGQDMEPEAAQIAPQDQQDMVKQQAMAQGKEIARIYDVTAGKYDLVVKAGPSYATQREFAQAEIVEVIRAYPDAAPILGPMYLRNSDWPGADDAAEKLEQGQQGGDPQQAQQQAMAQMQQMAQQMQQLAQENQTLKQQWALKARELEIKDKEADIKAAEIVARQQSEANATAMRNARQAQPGSPFTVDGPGQ